MTRLLRKAVEELPEDERQLIFDHFFDLGVRTRLPTLPGDPADMAAMFPLQAPRGATQVMIPVRLPEAQHRRLKEWCAEHNFPMAVVVRGLIDRFLDSWDQRGSEPD